ncbi:MAG: DUF971 domain-containing protein [Gammaproteobacteria bacterium]|nr:MAG: DUF971 domain-containing protein [Gammaproteobacteria bacterium]
MTEQHQHIVPTDIELHQKSRILEITFSDNKRFEYPCEYLRIKSQAAEVRSLGRPETGKENVNIKSIEQQGSYAIRIVFDDGHDTGIYSWETLYDLGVNFDHYWQDYLDALEVIGYERKTGPEGVPEGQKIKVTLLYFVQLPDVFGTDFEEVELPQEVTTVEQLLAWLRSKGKQQNDLLKDDMITVTINKQFTEPFTRLENGDEIAIVPKPV